MELLLQGFLTFILTAHPLPMNYFPFQPLSNRPEAENPFLSIGEKIGSTFDKILQPIITLNENTWEDQLMITLPSLTILVITILVICLNLFIIIARLQTASLQKRKKRLFEEWSAHLFRILDKKEPADSLAQGIKPRDLEDFTEFLINYLQAIKGKEWDKITQIFRRAGLIDRELNYLKNAPLIWRRALAAYRLGEVRASEALPLLIETLKHEESMLTYSAATAIMNIGDVDSLKKTLILLLNHEGLSEELFSEIILGYGKSINSEFIELMTLYEKLPRSRLRIIDFLGYFKSIAATPIFIKLLISSKDIEERIRLVKALGNITSPEAIPVLRACLQDPNPVIRSQAAKALGNFEDAENIDVLSPLLEDSDWWCRNHAANSIMKIGLQGKSFLERKLRKTKDSFAKDMIKQVLQASQ